jgi:hypothetical protein
MSAFDETLDALSSRVIASKCRFGSEAGISEQAVNKPRAD